MANRNYRAQTTAQRHPSPYRKARRKQRPVTVWRRVEAVLPQLELRKRLTQMRMPTLRRPTFRLELTSGWHRSKWLSAFLMVAGAATIFWVQSDVHWFVYADTIKFSGATYVTDRELVPTSGVEGWNVFWLRPDDIRENLLHHPYVADAEVRIELPNRVHVAIREPAPVAVWMTDIGPQWVLEDGSVLEIRIPPGQTVEAQLRGRDGKQLPMLVDMQRAATAVNRLDPAVDQEVLKSALALLERMPAVTQLRYNRGIGLNFALPDSPYWVYWGDGADLAGKLEKLAMSKRLLEQGEVRGQVIDVRFNERLVVR